MKTLLQICFSVLTELFEKADISDDGKVSLEELMVICTEHGVQLSEEGKEGLATVFGLNREVNETFIHSVFSDHKSNLISHIKKNNLARHFVCMPGKFLEQYYLAIVPIFHPLFCKFLHS